MNIMYSTSAEIWYLTWFSTCKPHSGYGLNQLEKMLYYTIISHWLSHYPERSLTCHIILHFLWNSCYWNNWCISKNIEAWTKWSLFCRYHFHFNFPSYFIQISLKSVPMGPIDKSGLIQVMNWQWTGGKSLLEPMMARISDTIWWHLSTMS